MLYVFINIILTKIHISETILCGKILVLILSYGWLICIDLALFIFQESNSLSIGNLTIDEKSFL